MLTKRHLFGVAVMGTIGAATGLSIFGELGALGGGLIGTVGGVKLGLDIEREQATADNGNGAGR